MTFPTWAQPVGAERPTVEMPQRRTYWTLDMLRAIAAISVMFYHYSEFLGGVKVLPKAYLAVDLFFLLSGFVIAHAYEQKIVTRSLSWSRFMLLRIIRLYPMYAVALALGVSYLVVKSFLNPSDPNALAAGSVIASALFLPWPAGEGSAFPYNPAAWSLFAEIVVNLGYVVLAPRLSNRALIAVIVGSLVALIATGFSAGSLDVGSSIGTFWGGMVRVAFSFSVGLLIWRKTRDLQPVESNGILALIPLTILIFGFSFFQGPVYDLVIVAAVFPMLVWLGARHDPPGAIAPTVRLGADLSYPIYVLHGPVLMIVAGGLKVVFGEDIARFGASVGMVMAGCTLVGSYILLKMFDDPTRRFLGRAVRRPRKAQQAGYAPKLSVGRPEGDL